MSVNERHIKKGKTPDWVSVFTEALRASGNVQEACREAAISRAQAYRRKAQYPGFAKQWQDALDDALDVLEAEAWRRAKSTSDTLLIFLLKAHRPEMYRDTIHVNVSDDLRIRVCESVVRLAAAVEAIGDKP